jgi:hypothetical protein
MKISQLGACTVYAPGRLFFEENRVDLEKPQPRTSISRKTAVNCPERSGSLHARGNRPFDSATTPLKTVNASIISASATSRLENLDADCDLEV